MDDIISLGDTSLLSTQHTHHVQHPETKKPLELGEFGAVKIHFVGYDSDEAEKANIENRKLAHQRAVDGVAYDPVEEDRNLFRLMARCTKGWENVPASWVFGKNCDNPAAPVAFSQEHAEKAYARLAWLRGQMGTQMGKKRGFTQALSES